jgi:hypothetical protein
MEFSIDHDESRLVGVVIVLSDYYYYHSTSITTLFSITKFDTTNIPF